MADEQTTISKDADSAVLVASVFLIYVVFFICAVMLYKMLKINSFWSLHLDQVFKFIQYEKFLEAFMLTML